ncbi:MAG TPA: hypothetical protein VEG30_16465 [Terriglobales bacterium]|nr:hypothetical protein [Terriglobales bacterium]
MFVEIVFIAVTVLAAALFVGGWSLLFFFWRAFEDGNDIDPIYLKPGDPVAQGPVVKAVKPGPRTSGLSGKAAA